MFFQEPTKLCVHFIRFSFLNWNNCILNLLFNGLTYQEVIDEYLCISKNKHLIRIVGDHIYIKIMLYISYDK
jgi:hypothetical protein